MTTEAPRQARWAIAPYFVVEDVVATAEYYRSKLGFHFERFWGEPPCFTIVNRNGICIMLSQVSGAETRGVNHIGIPGAQDAWDAYIWVDRVDELHAEFTAAGVKIVREICDQEYGCRDFDMEDCNGYRLCFGQSTAP